MYIKLFNLEETDLRILYGEYHDYWWSDDEKNRNIVRNDITLVRIIAL